MGAIVLTKANSGEGDGSELDGVRRMRVGVSWDAAGAVKKGFAAKIAGKLGSDVEGRMAAEVGSDLDAFATLLTQGDPKRLCSGLDEDLYNPFHGREGDGSIVHSGDNKTGKGEGDDEWIDVDLTRIPLRYDAIVFAVANYKGKRVRDFQGVHNVVFTGYDSTSGSPQEHWAIEPSLLSSSNCCLVARVIRTSPTDPNAPWKIEILEKFVGITPGDRTSLLRACVTANSAAGR